jgi:hypothetical protein
LPQIQLPIFPAGVTEINSQIAVQHRGGQGVLSPRSPAGVPARGARRAEFRMFTSQMIEGGTGKPKEIVKAFGVPMITVKRYTVLKGQVLEQAHQLLDEGRSVPDAVAALNLLTNRLHKAIRAGHLRGSQEKARGNGSNQPERTQPDRLCATAISLAAHRPPSNAACPRK